MGFAALLVLAFGDPAFGVFVLVVAVAFLVLLIYALLFIGNFLVALSRVHKRRHEYGARHRWSAGFTVALGTIAAVVELTTFMSGLFEGLRGVRGPSPPDNPSILPLSAFGLDAVSAIFFVVAGACAAAAVAEFVAARLPQRRTKRLWAFFGLSVAFPILSGAMRFATFPGDGGDLAEGLASVEVGGLAAVTVVAATYILDGLLREAMAADRMPVAHRGPRPEGVRPKPRDSAGPQPPE